MIENKRLQQELIEKNRYLQGLHDSAQAILMKYAPLNLPKFSCCEAAYIYQSCDRVGGDMLDVFDTGDHLFFYVFDVCSHGILAAVNTIIIKAHFCKLKNYHSGMDIPSSLKKDFQDLNLEMCRNTPSGVFATVFAGCIEKKTNKLYYISAGHIDQYLIHDNTLYPLSSTGTIMGSFENAQYDVYQHQLLTGDKLLLFTDGFPETWEKRDSHRKQSFMVLLDSIKAEPVDKMIDRINCEVLKASNEAPDDDLTILALAVKPHETL